MFVSVVGGRVDSSHFAIPCMAAGYGETTVWKNKTRSLLKVYADLFFLRRGSDKVLKKSGVPLRTTRWLGHSMFVAVDADHDSRCYVPLFRGTRL